MFKTFFKSKNNDSSLRNDIFEALRIHKDLDLEEMVFKKKLTQHENSKISVKKYIVSDSRVNETSVFLLNSRCQKRFIIFHNSYF